MNNCCEKCKTNRNEVATGEPICNNRNCPCHKPTNVNRLTDISLEEALPLIAENKVIVVSTPKVSGDWVEEKIKEYERTDFTFETTTNFIRTALQEATQRGRDEGIKFIMDNKKDLKIYQEGLAAGKKFVIKEEIRISEEAEQRGRDEVLKEVLEIIETKLKNDPRNPVLVAGLQYAVVVLKSIK